VAEYTADAKKKSKKVADWCLSQPDKNQPFSSQPSNEKKKGGAGGPKVEQP